MKLNNQENQTKQCLNIYGEIPGQKVGVTFSSRRGLCVIHNSKTPIAVGPEGPLSIVLVRKVNMSDHGYMIEFATGETQKFTGDRGAVPEGQYNKNLLVSIRSQLPIRIIRGPNLHNCFAPNNGFRYDGLYFCKGYQSVVVRNKLVFKFVLMREINQATVPWEWEGTMAPQRQTDSTDQVEITSEHSIKENEAINLKVSIGSSFCLGEDEYSQIEGTDSPSLKVESDDNSFCEDAACVDITMDDHEQATFNSNALYTPGSADEKNILAQILEASGVISKEIRIGNRDVRAEYPIEHDNWQNDHQLSWVEPEYDSDERDTVKMERVEVKEDFADARCTDSGSKCSEVDAPPIKMECSPCNRVESHDNLNADPISLEEDNTVKVENAVVSPDNFQNDVSRCLNPDGYIASDQFQNRSASLSKNENSNSGSLVSDRASNSESLSQEFIYVKANNSPIESAENSNYIHNVHIIETNNGVSYAIDNSYCKMYERISPEEAAYRSEDSSQKPSKSKCLSHGIQALSIEAGNCQVEYTINETSSINFDADDSTEQFECLAESYNREIEKTELVNPNNFNCDIKINPLNFNCLGGSESWGVFCRKCTPPSELIEPLMGKLSSVFSYFYSEYYCKCGRNSSDNSNYSEYVKSVVNNVVKLTNNNVEFVSAIAAFFLSSSRTDLVNGDPASIKTSDSLEKPKYKRRAVRKKKKNVSAQKDLIESNDEFRLIKRNVLDYFDLHSVALGGQLVAAGSDETENTISAHLPQKSKAARRSQNKPANKRRLKRRTTETFTEPVNSAVISNVSNPSHDPAVPNSYGFPGFTDYDINCAESQRDLTVDAMTPALIHPTTYAFKGFSQSNLKRSRHSDQYFSAHLKNYEHYANDKSN